MNFIRQFIRDEEGVAAIEYGVLAVIIATVVISQKETISGVFSTMFGKVTTSVNGVK